MLSEELYTLIERRLVEAFRRVFGDRLVALILFGSYARREARPESDIDLLVVVDDSLSDRLEVHKLIDCVEDDMRDLFEALRSKGFSPVLSPHVLTLSQARAFRPLYLDMVFDARILYDPHGFAKNLLDRVRRALERVGVERRRLFRGWVVVLKPRSYRFGDRIVLELDEERSVDRRDRDG